MSGGGSSGGGSNGGGSNGGGSSHGHGGGSSGSRHGNGGGSRNNAASIGSQINCICFWWHTGPNGGSGLGSRTSAAPARESMGEDKQANQNRKAYGALDNSSEQGQEYQGGNAAPRGYGRTN